MSMCYILDEYRQPVAVADPAEWMAWLHSAKKERTVKQEFTKDYYWISTVFFGMDVVRSIHGGKPLRLFETLVFAPVSKGGDPISRQLSSTWKEAEQVHKLAVRQLNRAARLKGKTTRRT